MTDDNLTQPLVDGTRDGTNQQPPRGVLLAVFAPLLSVIASILSNYSSGWCDFAYRLVSDETSTTKELEYSTQVGIWAYESLQNSETCYYYPSGFPIDSYLKASRAFANLTYIFGFTAVLLLLFTPCCPHTKGQWKCIGIFLMMACFFQGFEFLIMSSNVCTGSTATGNSVSCELRRGGKCCIAAVVFWFISGMSVLRSDPIESRHRSPARTVERVNTTEEVRPDGTRVINTTTTYEYV
eukprot:CAMPEP_0172486878 /NCGR_PEP_ID=MMETSP1066-20121228/15641_1 /TAXON_ID=671091 /ORGANISM="Coscinodiscus wailesii, Strain CCMP2513" /LENGTH=238 /DNA_ID=CAMNT_0013253117 /DNA_START=73 /DNA_END=789 /DNA_ORIENTATION=-